MAHVGVLKAIEENNIPIDYITGTSIGALVGGMYAAGYSPDQIERILTSEAFKELAVGEIEDRYIYYFRKPDPNANWIKIKFSSLRQFIETSIPTSFINPAALDLELMNLLDPAGSVSGYDFDSLFVPFRCLASDIEDKRSVLFKEGNLNVAVRASMTYPAYLKPLKVDGKMLFDGGLYNNFPTDVMRDEFAPDVIIGSNVSSNEEPPKEDDFLSQLKNMVVSKTNYELLGDCCVLIEPNVNFGTFNFNHLEENIDSGYTAASRQMEEIKEKVHRRVHSKVVNDARRAFNEKKHDLVFTEFEYEGLDKKQSKYVSRILKPKKDDNISFQNLKRGYYHVYQNEKVERLFPYAEYIKGDTTYKLHLKVKEEKHFFLEFGGNVSSRPINTGYIGLGYNTIRSTGLSLRANAYFGKLYASVLGKARIDLPTRFPFYFEPMLVANRWNYFSSRATFFEDNNSLFLIQNEQFARLRAAFPLGNKTKMMLGGSIVSLRDSYYQTSSFGQDDITDNTLFFGPSYEASLERNSLNDKHYANEGSMLSLSFRYTKGEETYVPGTTGGNKLPNKTHEWIQLIGKYDLYYKSFGFLRLGLFAEGVYSNQKLFSNYTASQLQSHAFQPTPESRTLFLESFRAYQYAALGHKFIFNLVEDIDIRLEGYVFQPYRFVDLAERQAIGSNGEPLFDLQGDPIMENYQVEKKSLERRYTIATANLVYRSPLGPIGAGVNYYFNLPEISGDDINPRTPVTFLFHFGYILFNEKALK